MIVGDSLFSPESPDLELEVGSCEGEWGGAELVTERPGHGRGGSIAWGVLPTDMN